MPQMQSQELKHAPKSNIRLHALNRECASLKNGTKIKRRLEFLEGRLYQPIIRIERI
jgi:hypothetical protein